MTQFCTIEGTRPERKGSLSSLANIFSKPKNTPLLEAILNNDIIQLHKLLTNQEWDINAPARAHKNVNSGYNVWRTPLEWAVDLTRNPEIVILLLENGAKPTMPALKLALAGAIIEWVPARSQADYQRSYKIIEILSAAGANWDEAYMPIKDKMGLTTFTPDDLIKKLGSTHAASLGVQAAPNKTPTLTSVEDFINSQNAKGQAAILGGTTPVAPSPPRPKNRI